MTPPRNKILGCLRALLHEMTPLGGSFLCVALTVFPVGAEAQSSGQQPKVATKIPNSVETSLGTLKFFDGLPDKETVAKVYDNLDLIRGVDVFLSPQSAASTLANIEGLKSVGIISFAQEKWRIRSARQESR